MKEHYLESPWIHNLTTQGYDIENVSSLFDGVIEYGMILPNKSIQGRIIKHYLLTPSQYCNILGVLLSHGVSGCGKSDIVKIGSAIHGLSGTKGILSAESSVTSIRNEINLQKFGDDWLEDSESGIPVDEKDSILLWDDVTPQNLRNPVLLSILKSGTARDTAYLKIAEAGTGKNISFSIFSKKVTSSIHPIWQRPELQELKRRTLVIRHTNYQTFTSEDKAANLSPDDDDLILWDYVDFSDYRGLEKYWTNYASDYKDVSKNKAIRRYIQKYRNLTNHQKQIAFDQICTAIIVDDLSVEKCCELYADYFQWITSNALNQVSALELYLRSFVKFEFDYWTSVMHSTPHEIDSKLLLESVDKAYRNGEILEPYSKSNITETMGALGYSQQRSNINSKIVWVRFS